MQNWDEAEERGNSNCSARQDLADAQAVCQKLHISLHTVNFVKEYWSDVFTSFISQVLTLTPPGRDTSELFSEVCGVASHSATF